MHSILNNHNRRLLDELNRNSGGPDVASCDCRSKGECPLGERCNLKNVIYQACISPMEHDNEGERVYIGISAGNWKQRQHNHRHSFSNPRLRIQTALLNIFGALRIGAKPSNEVENSEAAFNHE